MKDDYFLSKGGDADFKFSTVPSMDPTFGFSDDELNAWPKDRWDEDEKFIKAADSFGEELKCDPYTGYMLIDGCIKAGYDPKEHGIVHFWLWDRMGWLLVKRQATEEWRRKVAVPGYVLSQQDELIVKALKRDSS